MKTILHISKYYYPDLGGIETVAMYLAEGMTNYHNVVICFATDGMYSEEDIRGVILQILLYVSCLIYFYMLHNF